MIEVANLSNFEKVNIERPSDVIIDQIKRLIESGELKPGQQLPSERKLSQKLSVSRSAVREALKKLEFYGVLKTVPQSGTIVAGIGTTALKGLISNILNIHGSDFRSLVETRVFLEIGSVRLAALRRDDEDIDKIGQALNEYCNKVKNKEPTIDEDMLFHLKIAEASKNSVLKSLMLVLIPDILSKYMELNVCTNDTLDLRIKEHEEILEAIVQRDCQKAVNAMNKHLADIKKFSNNSSMNE